ncbi:MAG: sialidase family protein [Gemmatimonadales bacterium]
MDRRDFLAGVAAAGAAVTSGCNPFRRAGAGASAPIALEPPGPGVSVYEPSIAIDPANPERIAVAAQYGVRGGRGGRNIHLWLSEDGGRRWHATRVPRPKLDGEFAADPLTAFHEDGGLIVGSNFSRRWIADLNDGNTHTRSTVPSFEELWGVVDGRIAPPEDLLTSGGIAVSRVEDGGRTLSATVVPGISPGADKTSMALDRSPASPHRGAIYVAWSDQVPSVRVARSVDGGRSFAEPVTIETRALAAMQQIAVRPDGSVHLMWTSAAMPGLTTQLNAGADGAPDAGSLIYHAVSRDGGASFGEPTAVASHAGVGMVGIPSLAADASGSLLWVWGQSDELPDPSQRPVLQARHRLFAIRSDGDADWSAPYELCPWVPTGTHMGLPVVATGGTGWWLLTYLADDERTRVVLLRSDDGRRFELDRTLATRPYPVDEISLMGSYLLRFCDEIPQIGDYVGLAVAGSRVGAAFVLPESVEPTSRATVHVSLSDVR